LLDKKAATEKAKGEVKTGESTDTTEAATDNIHAAAGIQARLPANTGRKKNGRKNKKRGGKSN
jgi:hypothetical protein